MTLIDPDQQWRPMMGHTSSPYLFPDAVHDLDLLDRSVAATLLVPYVEWPRSNVTDPLGVGDEATEERLDLWNEHWVRGDFVHRQTEKHAPPFGKL